MGLQTAQLGQLANINLPQGNRQYRPSIWEQALASFVGNMAAGAGEKVMSNAFSKDYAPDGQKTPWYSKVVSGPAKGEKEYMAEKALTLENQRDDNRQKLLMAELDKRFGHAKEMTGVEHGNKKEIIGIENTNAVNRQDSQNKYTSEENKLDRSHRSDLQGKQITSTEKMADAGLKQRQGEQDAALYRWWLEQNGMTPYSQANLDLTKSHTALNDSNRRPDPVETISRLRAMGGAEAGKGQAPQHIAAPGKGQAAAVEHLRAKQAAVQKRTPMEPTPEPFDARILLQPEQEVPVIDVSGPGESVPITPPNPHVVDPNRPINMDELVQLLSQTQTGNIA